MTYDISKSSKSSASEKVAKKKAWRGREVGLGGGPASTSSRFAPQSRRLQVSRDGKLTFWQLPQTQDLGSRPAEQDLCRI